ncbi:phosphoribosylaminoimidazolesuccinocarboxamide synthase [bacterium]|nr:phosphoribosylaminoimidazolesuccinocarboxamide synthase [bacterium]
MSKTMSDICIPLKKIHSGKVRELFEVDNDTILMVATDRISAFDYILPTPIPDKGVVLTQMSLFWFDLLADILPNHIVKSDFNTFPDSIKKQSFLRDRAIIVKKANRLPIEAIVRGYIVGSGWKEYLESGKVCGVTLPEGLKEGDKLTEPIFTPTTKEEEGKHDRSISLEETETIIGKEFTTLLKEKSIQLYNRAYEYALNKGIIIADTKFEFGIYKNRLIIIDELLTPDSSRFWEVENYKKGLFKNSLDKQYIRDYLLTTGWDKNSPPPVLPQEVISKTIEKYKQIYTLLSGKSI